MKNLSYLFGILLVAAVLFSYHLWDQNRMLQRQVYVSYTNELATASERMNDLRSAVHQSLLFQDEVALQEELSTISRLSSEVKNSINSLPIDRESANEWNDYLTRLGSAALNAKNEGGENWAKTMKQAATNMDEIVLSWQNATSSLLTFDGDSSGWDSLLLDEKASVFADNAKLVSGYREKDFPLTASESDAEKKRDLQFLQDKNITKDEAITAFKAYFPEIENSTLTVSVNKDSAPYSFYHIQFVQGSRIGYADVTEKGGHILSFLLERPITNKVKSHEAIQEAAEQFLKSVGYEDVEYVESRENNTVWHFVYSRVLQDGTIVYPDSIQIKVAKDTAEILGVNAMEYIQKETIPEQKEVAFDPKTFFQPNIEVVEMKKIITNNKQFESRLCYEIMAFNKDNDRDTFRVIVDAETHVIHKIEAVN